MPYEVLVMGWLGVASLFGGASALAAARWGRDPFAWVLLGAVFGPLGLLLLAAMHRDDLRRPVRYMIGPATGSPRRTGSRVLLAVDDSPASLCAAEYVIERYGATGRLVDLMAVLPLERADGLESPEGSVRRSRLERDFEECVVAPRELLCAAGLRVHTVMAFGEPWRQISRVAKELGSDLTVVGLRAGTVASILRGPVPGEVAKVDSQPLIVVDEDRHAIVGSWAPSG
jgi:hypothetical protein